ncbi:MAG: hypothetical protein WCD38_11865 [Candidatus Tumulicola sp.]
MSRRRNEPLAVEPYDPYKGSGKRSFLPTETEIPGIHEDLVGGHRAFDPNRDDTVVRGHPEAAAMFDMNYDNRSIDLKASPTRMDKNYISPEEVRRRSKSRNGW